MHRGARMTTQSAVTTTDSPSIRSLIPARIDRLPWSRFFTKLVIALGIAWILDGLEITIASNVGPDLTLHNTLNLGAGAVADIAWWYLIGEVIGALFFGRLSDKLGRKNLFMITLGVYLIGSGLTAATPGGGTGSVPVRHPDRRRHGHRRRVRRDQLGDRRDDPGQVPGPDRPRGQRHLLGRRAPRHDRHALGAEPRGRRLGLADRLPGRPGARALSSSTCGATCRSRRAGRSCTAGRPRPRRRSRRSKTTWRRPRASSRRSTRARNWRSRRPRRSATSRLLVTLFRQYPTRSVLVFALMSTQSFLYNAIFFTYGLVLEFFFHVKATDTAYYFFAFAAGNLLGPLTIGRLFDTIGRRKMISGTYMLSGILLAIAPSCSGTARSTRPRRRCAGRSSSSSPRRARAPAT